MTTPHEAVARAVALEVSGSAEEAGFHYDEATAAIEALREGALRRLKRLSLEQQMSLFGHEKAIIDAILGPPAASFDTSSGSGTVDLGPPERKGK